MDAELLQLLSASGDVAIWLVVMGFWKLDRRLSRLEWERDERVNTGKALAR